ncbi:MAG: RDD family protein [Dermatophilaceae bacterium]
MPGSDADDPAAPISPPNASLLRRAGAVLVDWLLCQLVVIGLLRIDSGQGAGAFAPLALFALVNLVLVSTVGSTIGHRLFGLQVWQVRSGRFPLQVLVRTVLLCLFVPAILTGRDGRSLHDIAAGTRIVHLAGGG